MTTTDKCPKCLGDGSEEIGDGTFGGTEQQACSECGGTGRSDIGGGEERRELARELFSQCMAAAASGQPYQHVACIDAIEAALHHPAKLETTEAGREEGRFETFWEKLRGWLIDRKRWVKNEDKALAYMAVLQQMRFYETQLPPSLPAVVPDTAGKSATERAEEIVRKSYGRGRNAFFRTPQELEKRLVANIAAALPSVVPDTAGKEALDRMEGRVRFEVVRMFHSRHWSPARAYGHVSLHNAIAELRAIRAVRRSPVSMSRVVPDGERLRELQDLWNWFVDDARDEVHPDLRMNAVGNEIRRRIIALMEEADAD